MMMMPMKLILISFQKYKKMVMAQVLLHCGTKLCDEATTRQDAYTLSLVTERRRKKNA
jgi:hypothetical protein